MYNVNSFQVFHCVFNFPSNEAIMKQIIFSSNRVRWGWEEPISGHDKNFSKWSNVLDRRQNGLPTRSLGRFKRVVAYVVEADFCMLLLLIDGLAHETYWFQTAKHGTKDIFRCDFHDLPWNKAYILHLSCWLISIVPGRSPLEMQNLMKVSLWEARKTFLLNKFLFSTTRHYGWRLYGRQVISCKPDFSRESRWLGNGHAPNKSEAPKLLRLFWSRLSMFHILLSCNQAFNFRR